MRLNNRTQRQSDLKYQGTLDFLIDKLFRKTHDSLPAAGNSQARPAAAVIVLCEVVLVLSERVLVLVGLCLRSSSPASLSTDTNIRAHQHLSSKPQSGHATFHPYGSSAERRAMTVIFTVPKLG